MLAGYLLQYFLMMERYILLHWLPYMYSVPGASPEMVVLVPVPVVVIPPGVRVSVHVPVAGKPFNTTLPVATVHVGCVIVPTEGAAGDRRLGIYGNICR